MHDYQSRHVDSLQDMHQVVRLINLCLPACLPACGLPGRSASLEYYLNVETPIYWPQAVLSLDFHCRTDISESN